MNNPKEEIEKLKKEINTAEAIVIGAGAGLSTAAGFTYSGERFEKFFLISLKNMASKICILADFILFHLKKNFGLIGADIFI